MRRGCNLAEYNRPRTRKSDLTGKCRCGRPVSGALCYPCDMTRRIHRAIAALQEKAHASR